MIRRALLFAIIALALQLILTTLLSFVQAAVRSPEILINPRILEFALWLFPSVTMIAFLAVLLRELSGYHAVRPRQLFALAAASGMVVRLGLACWQLYRAGVVLRFLPRQMRTLWVTTAIWSILPTIAWIAFLVIFWREAAPLGRKWTRYLAASLCILTAIQGVYGAIGFVSRLQRFTPDWTGRAFETTWSLIVTPALLVAVWIAVPYFFFSVWRTLPVTAQSLEVPAPECR